MAKATFGMGCFWGAQEVFDGLDGVTSTVVGFANGDDSETDTDVIFSGEAGHAEVVVVEFDSERLSYGDLLDAFWSNHDSCASSTPIVRSALIVHDASQRAEAEASVADHAEAGVCTTVEEAGRFWPAPEAHQHYQAKQRQAEAAE